MNRRDRPRLGARVAGVSLLEMLLVVALIAIASTLAAMVLTGGMDGMRLRSASKEIAAELRFTRARAMATGQPQRFLIDPQAHRWQGVDGHRGEIPKSLSVRFTGARQASARRGQGGIVFYPDGASSGGRVQLQAGRGGWRIDVRWLTGEVSLSRAPQESL